MLKGRLGLILPFVAFGVLFALYTVLWHRSAGVMEAEIERFAEREAAAGRRFAYDTLQVEGYPLSLRGKLGGVVWQSGERFGFASEEVAIITLPYDPSRILFQPRGEKSLTMFGEPYALEADDLRFSFERSFAAAEGHGVLLRGAENELRFAHLRMNRQQLTGGDSIAFSMQGLQFPEEGVTFPTIDLAGSRSPGGMVVKGLGLRIASSGVQLPTEIVGRGEIASGPDGRLNGELLLDFQREEAAIDALEEFGILSSNTARLATSVLGLYSSKGEEAVELPMTITDGRVKIGSIPIGTLPPLSFSE